MDALKPCPFCGGIKLKFNKCASVIYCERCGTKCLKNIVQTVD